MQHLKKSLPLGLLLALLLTAIVSCGTITVYDKEVCADLGEIGADCTTTITGKSRELSKAQWDSIRTGYFCMDSRGYTDTETAIDQFCNAYNVCDYKTREQLQATAKRLRKLAKKAAKARKMSSM